MGPQMHHVCIAKHGFTLCSQFVQPSGAAPSRREVVPCHWRDVIPYCILSANGFPTRFSVSFRASHLSLTLALPSPTSPGILWFPPAFAMGNATCFIVFLLVSFATKRIFFLTGNHYVELFPGELIKFYQRDHRVLKMMWQLQGFHTSSSAELRPDSTLPISTWQCWSPEQDHHGWRLPCPVTHNRILCLLAEVVLQTCFCGMIPSCISITYYFRFQFCSWWTTSNHCSRFVNFKCKIHNWKNRSAHLLNRNDHNNIRFH